ncbi:hypothetical protein M6B38_234455 [Iris pallida]|uniref:Uncharacterized protein n=1 Tax=Iris pallida TaxID=29817 RepID=A0AAX6DQI4_IRIPA|nr:hypothetical protein M6B38_234455 [Iris pallida]
MLVEKTHNHGLRICGWVGIGWIHVKLEAEMKIFLIRLLFRTSETSFSIRNRLFH